MAALYLDCSTGLSGDMLAAALIDLGADRHKLEEVLASLNCPGFQIKIAKVTKQSLQCTDFDVILDEDNHDHDMQNLYGHLKPQPFAISAVHPVPDQSSPLDLSAPQPHLHEHREHEHHHPHDCEHAHDHAHLHDHAHPHEHGCDHGPEGHGHGHTHRNLNDVVQIIKGSCASEQAKALAVKTFEILAKAEAKAHGKGIDEVHFHEVGALDSIADILSACVLLDDLKADAVYIPSLTDGCGTVRCQHGILPVPVPAVVNIVQECGLNLNLCSSQGELLTPTGAALAAAFKTHDVLPKSFKILKTGLGAGKRAYAVPSIVRAMLIEPREAGPQEPDVLQSLDRGSIVKIESNIDDCTPENLGYLTQLLLEAGAKDVFTQPCFMKKQRPGVLLTVLCDEALQDKLSLLIFNQSTTIGVRRTVMQRLMLKRSLKEAQTSLGPVAVKEVLVPSQSGETQVRQYPEFESLKALSLKLNLPYPQIYALVLGELNGVGMVKH